MTYIITKDCNNDEINGRIKYIYDTFKIYVMRAYAKDDSIILKSVPKNSLDICLLYGHCNITDKFVQKNYKKIKEKNIIIISCYTKNFKSISKLNTVKKNVFLPKENIVKVFEKETYGFEFNITDEERMMYLNRNLNLEEMLNKIFRKE